MESTAETQISPRFGKRVREERVRTGVSQKALAKTAGMGVRTLIEVEHGRMSPTLTKADALARALGIPLSQLVH